MPSTTKPSQAQVEEAVSRRLKEVLPDWNGDLAAPIDHSRFDSLDFLEFAFQLEEEFDIIWPAELTALKSPRDLVAYILEHANGYYPPA